MKEMRAAISRLTHEEKLRLMDWVGNGGICACNDGPRLMTDGVP